MKKFLFVLLLMLFVSNTSYAETHKNGQYGFQLEYSDDWTDVTEKFPDKALFLISSKTHDRRECVSTIVFVVDKIQEMPDSFSVNDLPKNEVTNYISIMENMIFDKDPDFTITSSKKETRHNIPYIIVRYEGLQSKENWSIMLIKNKIAYSMNFNADKYSDVFMSDWNEIFDSFLLSL